MITEKMRRLGSSPRVRGKPGRPTAISFMRGLIPACAGKTRCHDRSPLIPRAHPRVCGENTTSPSASAATAGSSPRVRGKLLGACGVINENGLIPACAGKTTQGAPSQSDSWAHPRVCGENRKRIPCRPWGIGSSPRVRGKPSGSTWDWARPRLIPACAGKTRKHRLKHDRHWAHPRVCGENSIVSAPTSRIEGSSPRVRGKLRNRRRPPRNLGLIPACAGKTTDR